jgi:hypothetical protein
MFLSLKAAPPDLIDHFLTFARTLAYLGILVGHLGPFAPYLLLIPRRSVKKNGR